MVVVLGFFFGFAGILYIHHSQRAVHVQDLDTGPGEAFAALAGAIVGIGGAEIGRATSALRPGQRKLRCEHVAFDIAIGLVALAAVCGTAWLFLVVDHAWSAAAAALLVAAIGVPWVHLHHERITPQRGRDIVGGLMLAVAVPLLAVGIVLWSPHYAEAAATIAVAVVGVAATLLSHGRGLQRQAPKGAEVERGST